MKISCASTSATITTDVSRGLYVRISESAASILPGTGRLAERRKRGGPFGASLSAVFPTRRDMWSGFVNLAGYLSRWSFLRAFVQHPQKSDGRFFVGFQFSPAFRSSAAHGQNMQRKDARSHEKCTREYE